MANAGRCDVDLLEHSFMKADFRSPFALSFLRIYARCLWLSAMLAGLQNAMATTLVSTVPANGAAGVAPAAPVVFTFSAAVNPNLTSAFLLDSNVGDSPPVIS